VPACQAQSTETKKKKRMLGKETFLKKKEENQDSYFKKFKTVLVNIAKCDSILKNKLGF
jgi:hypothetical protein